MTETNTEQKPQYLTYESRAVYALLMMSAGMMGAYTYNLRGGIFCNAQTANIVMMAIAFGKKSFLSGLYYLIPISAYLLGAFISEFIPASVKKITHVRWDIMLISFEIAVLIAIGFVPLSLPHQIVQIAINFICSMQYNSFRRAEGVPMATTFCTNHVRQVGVGISEYICKKNPASLKRVGLHLLMLGGFALGGALLTLLCKPFAEKSIWFAAVPLMCILITLIKENKQ